MTNAQQTAQIIHLSGMKKGLSQLVEVIQSQIEKIDSRLSELQTGVDDDE
jgi:hypothetical protein